MANQSLNPQRRRIRRRSPADAATKAPHLETLAVSHQSHCAGGIEPNAEHRQVPFSGEKHVKKKIGARTVWLNAVVTVKANSK